jgi:hypothetical protein
MDLGREALPKMQHDTFFSHCFVDATAAAAAAAFGSASHR